MSRSKSFAIRRDSKEAQDLSRNGRAISVQQAMSLKEQSSPNGPSKTDVIPDRAVYEINIGPGPACIKSVSNSTLEDLRYQLMCLREEIHNQEIQQQLDAKREERRIQEQKVELQEQLDKMRDEMKNQTRMTIKELVEENEETFVEIRRDIKRINRKH